ncbi:hypothetical protein [Methylobacterium sp. J-092]|uniref:hypothetical protein n=1 Tax=Methylobacterium sp. J-092 TaxID=2836667 RepID=UPI001FBB4414|nr:hypothetical protein [Methylobacterium sp. J-092]MCJ2009824.1 hypothetical protein [Methylobacterium sp. J-092]
MVTGMQGTILIVIAILALSLLIGRELVRATADARDKAEALKIADGVLDVCLATTERLLADDRLPPTLKRVLSGQLLVLGNSLVGGQRIRAFLSERPPEVPTLSDEQKEILAASDEIACTYPHLLTEYRETIAQGFFVILAMHAENWKAELSVQGAVKNPYGMPFGLDRLFSGLGLTTASNI